MTDIEFAAQIVRYIKGFNSPYQALQKVRAYPVPHKSRKLKKQLKKIIRTYIFITEQT